MGNFTQGDTFAGRYTLVQKLGFGGFSEVWKAEDSMTEGTVVAIKIYAPEKGLDDHGLKQFRREYALTQPLNHANLLKASYFDITDGSPYLVMPFCSQGSLHSKLMEQGKLSEQDIARVTFQVAGGLDYLHSKGILHQDIKPDNILINDDGTYVLTDFGISSRLRSTLRKATTQSTALTVAYAPPERFDKNPNNTEASDVFSFGVMMYELCEGDVPWMGQGGMTLLSGAGIPQVNDSYSPELRKLIEACMRKNPSLRPTTEQLVESARNYLANGSWTVDFIKPEQPAQQPPVANSGRQTEIITHIPEPTPSPEPTPTPSSGGGGSVDPNATRMDGAPLGDKPKKKTGLVVALILILVLAGGGGGYYFYAQSQKQGKYDDALANAYKLFGEKSYAEAKLAFDEALSVIPGDAAAQKGLDSLMAIISDEFDAAYGNGIALMEKSAYDEAIKSFETALSYLPDNDSAQQQLNLAKYNLAIIAGDAAMETKDYAAAMAKYKEALDLVPDGEVASMKYKEAERQEKSIRLAAVNKKLLDAVKDNKLADAQGALKEGADANAHDDKDVPALFWAVKNGNQDMVKALVGAGADCKDKSGTLWYNSKPLTSAIVIAAAYGNLDMVKYFVESCSVPVNDQSYNTSSKQNDGWSALSAASYFGKKPVASYLVQKGANIEQTTGSDKMTPLLEACAGGQYDVAKYLLEKKANVKAKTRSGKDAYKLATTSAVRNLLRDYGLGGYEYYDDFNSYASSYFFKQHGYREYSDKNKRTYISKGSLKIDLKGDIGYSFYETFNDLNINGNWSVEAKLKLENNFEPYGIIFAGSENNDSYRILVNPDDGSFSVKRLVNNSWRTVRDYERNSAINKGFNSNVIKVSKSGTNITVYFNGKVVLSNYRIPSYPGKAFGIYCETVNTRLRCDYFKLTGE